MICTNCFENNYRTAKTEVPLTINGVEQVLHDVDCEKCPSCNDIIFTHGQSLEVDKKRISLEFGLKPLLTPAQLKGLRRILDMNLDEICDVLHIGKNTYGRWERGDSDITPSMNLLVHNLVEKIPGAAVNLFPAERNKTLDFLNSRLLRPETSLGEYIRNVIEGAKFLPTIVCEAVDITHQELTKLQNNEVEPEKIPVVVSARFVRFFRLSIDALRNLMNNSIGILDMKSGVTAVHARSTSYDGKGASIQDSSVNKILEKLAQQKGGLQVKRSVSEQYLAKVNAAFSQMSNGVEP